LNKSPNAFEGFDSDTVGAEGFGFVRLNHLAVDHLVRPR
jgi:xylose isomerase